MKEYALTCTVESHAVVSSSGFISDRWHLDAEFRVLPSFCYYVVVFVDNYIFL